MSYQEYLLQRLNKFKLVGMRVTLLVETNSEGVGRSVVMKQTFEKIRNNLRQ